jgi:hypothetical protein
MSHTYDDGGGDNDGEWIPLLLVSLPSATDAAVVRLSINMT